MTRRLVSITLDQLDELPARCRSCVYWELDPVAAERAAKAGDPGLEKEAWVSATLLEWGSCGKLVQVDGVTAGYVMFSPPVYVPRSVAFPTSPVSGDAVLLTTGHVLPEFSGQGLGRMLIQGVAKDLVRREVKAIEAFGDAKWDGPGCLVPAEYLLAVGFKTVRPHHRFPRLRLEVKSTLSWREDVEVALERLLGSMAPEPALRPV
ncbi:GNAT family N-acetyltransferase [Sporichthya sp.]|uniref:GNAT family N-acetyltransferase n=1 Tax=Sporichthya sp. TaxID=65475 RepID=UPI0017E625CD|nr:GNAT family N-acetyltransferase [Sporichthya sp.]MBA3741682.1 GNAT family N-acetyltransferase [Sporichthya sp.]